MTRSRCKSCHASIVWCETEAGKRMPLDAEPSLSGNTIVLGLGPDARTPRVRVLSAIELPASSGPRYTSHFATCPQAAEHRRGG